MPAERLSADTVNTSAPTSWPRPASQTNSRLVAADSTAPRNSVRITPMRITSRPPSPAPTMVMITP